MQDLTINWLEEALFAIFSLATSITFLQVKSAAVDFLACFRELNWTMLTWKAQTCRGLTYDMSILEKR